MPIDKTKVSDEEALNFHQYPTPGKIGLQPTKPMATQRDLALAYSPGVAVPVRKIAENPDAAYDYTSKGNTVAVISNGTAILGLGNLGALASKPVMEGKAVLFKRFADIDSFDIEVATQDPDEFITVVKNITASFGGINLEDIKSPECFIIESALQDLADIPVFHDDQHGTAIIAAAGLINALEITGRRIEDTKVVLCGAGAAGLSSIGLIKAMGVKPENTTVVDIHGVVYKGRTVEMDQWKSVHATDTDKRTLAEAMVGADVVLGLSAKGVITPEMVATMAPQPIIFAMANPDPEITPEDVAKVRDDAIVATGRSDYPNQVNNVLGFPYIFRGALDVRARRVNHEMKLAAAMALAQLAREDVPDEVAAAYQGRHLKFGKDYIIPTPFDPRLIWYIPPFVAQAAMDTGVARKPIEDMDSYRKTLEKRLDPSAGFLQNITATVRSRPSKRIVFAEGEDISVIRAAHAFKAQGLGTPILCGRENLVTANMRAAGLDPAEEDIEIVNARLSHRNSAYSQLLYSRLQRKGFLKRDVDRLINQDRNSFAAAMVLSGHADGMVTGVTRSFDQAFEEVLRVVDPAPGGRVMGMSIVLARGKTVFIADTTVAELPDPEELVEIAVEAAMAVRGMGHTPRVAFMSYSTFGNPAGERSDRVAKAVELLEQRGVDFEFEGEMPPDVALDPTLWANYPFQRLTAPANILVMPAIHSASISTKLVQALGGATVVGPLLLGLSKPVQICQLSDSVTKILTMATFAAYDIRANINN
ncbi:NADP-dependent malic enzyme [Asticcacaulis excentricus]|uniref:Phosphate acetyl/butaryl transferase n=1 Tax=Asticcacaulis excentricus (strain ATCC 15261 / DSM 4724 / KCTC 12464 / NCIMB 9791 / VKM B-1370 / CB 48) TaxID=573065 RepID=E8RMX7_ASTEC|nr:NADP-dependent malic enzyme [Asticcacaulis excentricus]ADU11740.1 phosphate acetyl/butaryl transferase [Asticcacaulis excentricus CB 48]